MSLPADAGPLLKRLMSLAPAGGGMPYYRAGGPSTEPALLTLLAYAAAGVPAGDAQALLDGVAALQNPDGSVGVCAAHRSQGIWLTAPAALVFHRYGLKDALNRALGFMTSLASVTVANDPKIRQDNTIVGWPWVRGTFGWVEPTAWSVLALNAGGQGRHPRAAEGRRLLLDRQIPSGGWNYGNPGVNDRELLPFWDTTGLALLALSGGAEAGQVRPSLDFLVNYQERIESPCGLAWAALGLEAHGRDAARLKQKLAVVLSSLSDEGLQSAHFAAGLIALSGPKVFLP